MKNEVDAAQRRKWLAAVLGLAMPGLGQIYNSELLKGASYFVIFHSLIVIGLRLSVHLPDKLLMAGAILTILTAFAFFAFCVIDAYRIAGQKDDYAPKSYNRWYVYSALWLAGSVLTGGAVYSYTKNNIIEANKIATRCMEPAVMRGDYVLADRTAYLRMPPQTGDIVVLVHPDDRSKVFIRKIAALPGQLVELSQGRIETVPHGHVYVLGEADKSIDSRIFGFVPLKDLIGKVRQVYYSAGDGGIRWNRIGMTVGGTGS